jgi:hypothetical protein
VTKLAEINSQMASTTAHGIDLLDESNSVMQCQDVS